MDNLDRIEQLKNMAELKWDLAGSYLADLERELHNLSTYLDKVSDNIKDLKDKLS